MTDPQSLARGLRIGLMGGSFNPAHRGHLEITDAARRLLRLDRVWWLVSPQNPLKDAGLYQPLARRLAQARVMAAGRPWLRVSRFEADVGLSYTADTVATLSRRYPATRFVWLMGADSLATFHRWSRWRDIAATLPFAVLSRPGEGLAPMTSVAGATLSAARRPARAAAALASAKPPAWVYLPAVHNPVSSTALRARAGKGGFSV